MISVLIPTKARPDKLLRCWNSIDVDCDILIMATSPDDVPLVVAQDERVTLFIDRDMGVVQAQNFLASMASQSFPLVPTCDDVEYMPGAFVAAYNMLMNDLEGYGVVGFSVENMTCNDDAFVMVGQRWYAKHRLFCHDYQHFFADTELGDTAKKMRRFRVCRDAKMINYHPIFTKVSDKTHEYRRAEKLAHDTQVYQRRKYEMEVGRVLY